MPLWYRVDPFTRLLMITAEGALTQEERLAGMQAWMSDPDFEPGLNTLFDVTASTSTPTMAELRQIVDAVNRRAAAIGRIRLAVVTARPITFGVARQFGALAEPGPIQVEVFTSREAAIAWLRDEGPPKPKRRRVDETSA